MDLSDLRIFTAVVREGGVTRAAERLNRVQSNVTTRIRQLEEDLGVDLFLREGKRLHLAPAGQLLLGYADRLLALADEARISLRDPRPRGLFRLGAMESTAAVRLPGAINQYSRLHPEVTLELRIGNPVVLSAAILAGELDAALVSEPIADAPFEKVLAFEEEPVIVSAAGHPPGVPALEPLAVGTAMLEGDHGGRKAALLADRQMACGRNNHRPLFERQDFLKRRIGNRP